MNGRFRRIDYPRHVRVGLEETIEHATHLLTGLHANDGFEMRRFNGDIARVLRVEYGAIENRRLVVTAVIML